MPTKHSLCKSSFNLYLILVLTSASIAAQPASKPVRPTPYVPIFPDVSAAGIRVDAGKIVHVIDDRIIGCNIEDLNYQCYGGVYSQLLHGESFEEHVDPGEVLGLTGKDRLAMFVKTGQQGQIELRAFLGRGWSPALARQILGIAGKGSAEVTPDDLPADKRRALLDLATGQRQVSRQWRPVVSGSAKGAFQFVRRGTFNGNQSQGIRFVSGSGEVGINNAGLNRWGINLVEAKPYEGLLRIKAEESCTVYVSLRKAGGEVLAEKAIKLAGKRNEYQRVKFTLTPDGDDTQGRFAITLKRPGSVVVGYAFLQVGQWGRFKGLPLKKELVQAVIDQGVKVMRYNGSMVNKCPDGHLYKWKEMIGPRDERQPYTGWFNPYASHGFGVFEFLDMCQSAGFLAVPGLRIDETAGDMADFVEYATGRGGSKWGWRRAADGHPDPYRLTHIQIGNEEKLEDHYVERFVTLGKAIWEKDAGITLVVSQNLSPRASDWAIGPNGEVGDLLRRAVKIVKFGADNGGTIWWDCHYRGVSLYEPDNPNGRIACMKNLRRSIVKLVPGYDGFKLAPLEENGTDHNMQRALVHARNLNAFMRMGDLPAVAVANTFQADGQDLAWTQGRTFFNASKVWFQPPYYVDRMIYRNWAANLVDVSFASPRNALDATARISDDGTLLIVQVVNIEPDAVKTKISVTGFVPVKPAARIIQIRGGLEDENTAAEPERIAPVERDWKHNITDGTTTFTFAPYSFTILRFDGSVN